MSSHRVQKIWTTADMLTCPRHGYQREDKTLFTFGWETLFTAANKQGSEVGKEAEGDVTASSLLWFDVIYSVCETKHVLAHTLDKKKRFHIEPSGRAGGLVSLYLCLCGD